MADVALYRKYRPQNFDNLVGQGHISRTLLNAIKGGHLSHAYLFCGPRGTGKTSSARLVAKAINCIAPESTGESCNKCEYCVLMNEGRLIDLIEIDAASNRGIDEIRDLREKIKFAPNQAPHKVYIIDEVHMLTTPAFNALLKTLEEPPDHAYFVLATTESHKVPDTIISRCQRFDFRRIANDALVDRLKHIAKQEQIEAEDEALELLARTAEGGMRNAISLFEQIASDGKLTQQNVLDVLGITGHEAVVNLYASLEKGDVETALKEIQGLHKDGQDLFQFNREFLNQLREELLKNVGKPAETQRIIHWIELFQTAAKDLKNAHIPQLPLEISVIKSCMSPEEAKGGWFSGILGHKKEEKPEEPKAAAPAPTPAPTPTKQEPKSGLKEVPTEEPAGSTEEEAIEQKPSAPIEASPSFTFEAVKQSFPRILESVPTPSTRQSFKTGLIQNVDGGVISMEFSSKFHLSKVDNAVAKSEIEAAFQKIFGQKVRLDCKIADVNKVVDATLDIFGGELVD
jgi:DNA polymerase-3 subunit gamma/tau